MNFGKNDNFDFNSNAFHKLVCTWQSTTLVYILHDSKWHRVGFHFKDILTFWHSKSEDQKKSYMNKILLASADTIIYPKNTYLDFF